MRNSLNPKRFRPGKNKKNKGSDPRFEHRVPMHSGIHNLLFMDFTGLDRPTGDPAFKGNFVIGLHRLDLKNQSPDKEAAKKGGLKGAEGKEIKDAINKERKEGRTVVCYIVEHINPARLGEE